MCGEGSLHRGTKGFQVLAPLGDVRHSQAWDAVAHKVVERSRWLYLYLPLRACAYYTLDNLRELQDCAPTPRRFRHLRQHLLQI